MRAVVLALAVPLIGLTGALLGAAITTRRENFRMRRELALERYRDGQRLFNELILLAGERFTALQRWLWAVQQPDAYDVKAVRDEYFSIVQSWNSLTWSYRARLRLMLGDVTALRFLDYADDTRRVPQSLHYMFVQVHGQVLKCESGGGNPIDTQRLLDLLNHSWSGFADDVAIELLRHAQDLQRLRIPVDDPTGRTSV